MAADTQTNFKQRKNCVYHLINLSTYNDKQPDNFQIILNNYNLNGVNSTKFLGIYIDSNMKWSSHINNVVKKSYYVIYIIKKLVKILNCQQVLAAYYALVESVLTYGIVGWGGVYKCHRKKLDNIHKRIIKIIYSKFNYNNYNNKKLNNILTLEGIFCYESIKINNKKLIEKYNNLEGKRVKR